MVLASLLAGPSPGGSSPVDAARRGRSEEDVVPGAIRRHSVTVGRYLGAPAEDCRYLLERLCTWLEATDFAPQPGVELVYAILKAIVAHVYLASIHPFGDGNGRTARVMEFQILMVAGVPTPAAHLRSNHYEETRAEYYRQLDAASRSGGDLIPFIESASRTRRADACGRPGEEEVDSRFPALAQAGVTTALAVRFRPSRGGAAAAIDVADAAGRMMVGGVSLP